MLKLGPELGDKLGDTLLLGATLGAALGSTLEVGASLGTLLGSTLLLGGSLGTALGMALTLGEAVTGGPHAEHGTINVYDTFPPKNRPRLASSVARDVQ